MVTALWIAAGGALGTLARFGLAGLVNEATHPCRTVMVNVLGSLALGVLIGVWGTDHIANHRGR